MIYLFRYFVVPLFTDAFMRDARAQLETSNLGFEKTKKQICFNFLLTIPPLLSQDRLLNSLADLTTLCIFLAISPSVRESASMVARGDLREMEQFRQFHVQASAIQREAISWLQSAVPTVFEPNRVDYIHCLRKVNMLLIT